MRVTTQAWAGITVPPIESTDPCWFQAMSHALPPGTAAAARPLVVRTGLVGLPQGRPQRTEAIEPSLRPSARLAIGSEARRLAFDYEARPLLEVAPLGRHAEGDARASAEAAEQVSLRAPAPSQALRELRAADDSAAGAPGHPTAAASASGGEVERLANAVERAQLLGRLVPNPAPNLAVNSDAIRVDLTAVSLAIGSHEVSRPASASAAKPTDNERAAARRRELEVRAHELALRLVSSPYGEQVRSAFENSFGASLPHADPEAIARQLELLRREALGGQPSGADRQIAARAEASAARARQELSKLRNERALRLATAAFETQRQVASAVVESGAAPAAREQEDLQT